MLSYFAFSFGFRFPEYSNRYQRIARPHTQFYGIPRMAQNAVARKRLPKNGHKNYYPCNGRSQFCHCFSGFRSAGRRQPAERRTNCEKMLKLQLKYLRRRDFRCKMLDIIGERKIAKRQRCCGRLPAGGQLAENCAPAAERRGGARRKSLRGPRMRSESPRAAARTLSGDDIISLCLPARTDERCDSAIFAANNRKHANVE